MALANIYQSYTKAQVRTDDPQKVLVLLFEGIISFLNKAHSEISDKQYLPAHDNFMKAKNIIVELMCALDMEQGGEIAQNLYNLYWFLFEKIVEADYTKNTATIDMIIPVIRTIKSGWEHMELQNDERGHLRSDTNNLNMKG